MHLEIHSEGVIEQDWKCSWRHKSRVFGDIHRGGDWVNFAMHFEIVIESVWRCAPGGHDQANIEDLIV